jgi:hypothetical protein
MTLRLLDVLCLHRLELHLCRGWLHDWTRNSRLYDRDTHSRADYFHSFHHAVDVCHLYDIVCLQNRNAIV